MKVVTTVGVQPKYQPIDAYKVQHVRSDDPENLASFFAERQIEYSKALQLHNHPDLVRLLGIMSREEGTAYGDWQRYQEWGFPNDRHRTLCDEIVALRRAGRLLKPGFEAEDLPRTEIRHINDVVGYGLFAMQDIPRGAFVGEYAGVLSLSVSLNPNSDYLMPLSVSPLMDYIRFHGRGDTLDVLSDTFLSIDPAAVGNETRFINHAAPDWALVEGGLGACNLAHLPVLHNGCWRMAMFATRDIETGEELRYDYGSTYFLAEHRRCVKATYRIRDDKVIEQKLR